MKIFGTKYINENHRRRNVKSMKKRNSPQPTPNHPRRNIDFYDVQV